MSQSRISSNLNWWIRRRLYSLDACDTLEDQSDQVDIDDAESHASTDDSTVFEVLEPYQLLRCQCPQPTWRMALVSGESEFRCFECLKAHCDQSAHYSMHIIQYVYV